MNGEGKHNYGNKDCRICQAKDIITEHYLHCTGTKYLRRKWGIDQNNEMKDAKISKYMRQVSTLITMI